MKKKTRRILLAGVSVVFAVSASLALLTACGGGKKVKLTLDAGEGGTLSKTAYSVKAGADLSDFLKDKSPVLSAQGITFAGWYNGTELVAEGTEMPAEPLTLTAKYSAPYHIEVYTRESAQSEAVLSAEYSTEGTGFWHEKVTLDPASLELPGGYAFDDKDTLNVVSTNKLEVGFTFKLYLVFDPCYISFRPNAPAGVEIGGVMPTATVGRGLSYTIPATEFTAPDNYCLIGWSKTENGPIEFTAGDSVTVAESFDLYAHWITGRTDVFDGGDYIFVSEETGDAYLHRAGLPEKRGVYDPNLNVFTFEAEGKTVLEGKLVGEDYYYYFRDLEGKTFVFDGGQKEELKFGAKGAVTYTVTPDEGDPVSKEGSYSVDPVTGDYFFEGDQSFFFTLFVDGTTKENRFTRTVENVGGERGFYAFYTEGGEGYDATTALQLDGMYDGQGFASAGMYQLLNGEYKRAVTTYYGLESVIVESGEEGISATADAPVNYALVRPATETSEEGYVLFRLEKKSFTANGRAFDGIFRLEDGFRGSFPAYADIMAGTTSLTLDGFGGANYLEKPAEGADGESRLVEATYTIGKIVEHGISIEYLAMKTSEKTFYVQFDDFNGLPYYLTSDAQPKVVDIAHSLKKTYGIYEGGEGGLKNLYDGGFLYFFNDVVVGVYSYFIDTFDGETQYSAGIDYGNATAKTDEAGVFTFQSRLAGDKILFEFRFAEDGRIEMTLPYMETLTVGEGEKTLKVDKWGALTYGGKTYAYGEYQSHDIYDYDYYDENDDGYMLREYVFGDTSVCLRASDSDFVFDTIVGENELLDIVLKQYPGQDDYFDRIYFIEGLPTDEVTPKRAGILLAVGDGEEVLLHGDLVYDGETYTLTLDDPQDEDLEEFYHVYGGEEGMFFSIKTFNGKTAAVVDDQAYHWDVAAEDGSSLKFDGFGGATYTPAEEGAVAFTGAYDLLAKYNNNYLVRIKGTNGEEKLFLLTLDQDGDAAIDFTLVTAPEAGYYAYMSLETGRVYYNIYIVFFGAEQEEGIFAEAYYDEDGATVQVLGYYKATGETIDLGDEEPFTEYELTYEDEMGDEQVSYIAAGVSAIKDAEGNDLGTMGLFVERIMPMGEYDVKEGGTISGDGYSISSYEDENGVVWLGSFGRENLIDNSPKQSEYGVEPGDHSKDGKQLFFYAEYMIAGGDVYQLVQERHFLFDVITDAEGNVINVSRRDNSSGTFALFEKAAINEDVLLYFDGHGNATLKEKGKEDVQGVYTYDEDTQSGRFTPDEGDVIDLRIYTVGRDGEMWYVFVNVKEEHLYVNEDWSVLSLYTLGYHMEGDTIYSGVYTDRYGDTHYGNYEFLTETLVVFANDHELFYFKVNEKGTFIRDDSEFVIEDGVLYAYQGPTIRTNGLKIPDRVTEIAEGVFAYMTIRGKIDFNEVEIIGARAFYESNISTDNDQTLSSEKVTEIGDEAFYTTFISNGAMNAISNLNFPALKKIGARAFYNCNQMRTGTVTLRDIESIGEQAFMHIVNPGSGTMALDLTAVKDLSKLTIADTAFDDIEKGAYNENGEAPVKILLGFIDLTKIEGWKQDFQDWSQVAEFMSADATAYIVFNKEGATKYTYEYGWNTAENAYTWTLEGTNVKIAASEGGQEVTIAANASVFELGGTTYYRTYAAHTLTVKEGDKQTAVEFTFAFAAEVTGFGFFTDITTNIAFATYGGHPSSYIYGWSAFTDGIFSFDIRENATDTYRVDVNMAEKTSEKKLGERILFSEDETYRAVFEQFAADGTPARLTSFGLKGLLYRNMISSSVYGQAGIFTFDVITTEEGIRTTTTYTVTYKDGDTPSFTVTSTSVEMYTVYVETETSNQFRATFLNSQKDATEMEQLFEFAIYDEESKSFQTIYGEGYFGPKVEKGLEENTFIVTVPKNSGTTSYTVKYVPAADGVKAHIVVTVASQASMTVETEHDEGENYYDVNFLVDQDGKVIGLQSIKTHREYNGWWYNDEMTYDANNVTKTEDGNKVTFVFSTEYEKYTVEITTSVEGGETVYAVTVQMEEI